MSEDGEVRFPARRACLIVPAGSEQMLKKARTIEADEVVIDLEDAVLPGSKVQARENAVETIASGGFLARSLAVRINAPGSPWAHEDLLAIASAPVRVHSVVVPKVQSAYDIAFVERLLDGVECATGHRDPLRVQALIETPQSLRSIDEICASSARLQALVLGYADLAALLGRADPRAQKADLWQPIQDAVLVAARAAGLQAIDGPYLAFKDEAGLISACSQAARLGFDGKWAIHPSQVKVVTDAFTPTQEDVRHAEAVLATLAHATNVKSGAVALDGEMLDEAMRAQALRTLARAAMTG